MLNRAVIRSAKARTLYARNLSLSPTLRNSTPALQETTQYPYFFNKVALPTSSDQSSLSPTSNDPERKIPAFRVLDGVGRVLPGVTGEWKNALESIPEAKLVKLYETMAGLPILDNILYSSQRQGRISFYMTSHGEEGAVVGSAAAWEKDDEIFSQYREVGALLWRDYPLNELLAQVFATKSDKSTKGRQMPIHYSSPDYHFHTISSPLATQIPQAAGAAYALTRTPGREKSCVVCYFGEGAASEGDFHAGLNMAAVLGGATIFFVRNNGFAISTPSSEQYRGDGIAARGPGYGIDTIRVDGNDPLAVYIACVEARKRAVEGQKPVLIEAMSYRIGHHSTSDDSSAYRSLATVDSISKNDSPLNRLRQYLESLPTPLWSTEKETAFKSKMKKAIMVEFNKAEKESKPPLEFMFGDVYGGDELERPIREQRDELKRLVGKWGETNVWKKELDKFDGGKEAFLKSS